MQRKFLPWMSCGILGTLAFFLKFCVPGYSFSALVCCVLIGILLFYTITEDLLSRFPRGMRMIRRIFTAVLCLGIAVAGVTECIILRYSFGDPGEKADHVVVLGAKVRDTGPSVSLWDRIYAAADYLHSHPDTIAIVSGGQGSDEPETEAAAMARELIRLGIAPERIWLEESATSTWENLQFSLNLIETKTGQRPEKIAVLSSEYHLFRASLFAKACGVEFVGVPARTSRLSQRINHFLREVAGVWHYLILGGQYD